MNIFSRTLRIIGLMLLVGALPLTALAQNGIQYDRPAGQQGVDVFEPPTEPGEDYAGFTVDWGAALTQQYQALDHSNDAGGLSDIGAGFNLATANLDLDAQLERGIRVHLRTYLSSRHHSEAWVKGGYLEINELPMFDSPALDNLMEYVTVRAGHMEVNYGDTHFRRTDNADAIQNPFVGNNVLDAFTTEVGAEVYVRSNGFLAMGAVAPGELNPSVVNQDQKSPSLYGKLGIDRQVNPNLRIRVTGSAYYSSKSAANHLHSGDRAGSRYYNIVGGGDHSGRIQSSFSDDVTALMLNPFLKAGGLELFGTLETVGGSRVGGQGDGSLTQYAGEALYRFADEDMFVGLRYNTVEGDLDHSGRGEPANWTDGNTVDRWQVGAGWFMAENVLLKGEYVSQTYDGFPDETARAGAEFSGLIFEAVITF